MGRKWIQPYKSVSSSPPFYPKQKQLYQVKAMHLPTYSILKHDRWRSSLGLLPWCILIIFNLSSWQISNINNNCTVQFLCVEPNFYCKYCCDDGDKSFLWSGSRHKISENLNTYGGWTYTLRSHVLNLIGSVIGYCFLFGEMYTHEMHSCKYT